MNNKRFRVSSNKRIAAAWALMGGFLAALIMSYFVADLENNAPQCVIAAAICGVVAMLACIIFVKEYYLQIYSDGFELTKGKEIKKYPFTAFGGSNVVRNYVNGIRTSTTREIRIIEADGEVTTINANHLSKGLFAEMVSYLGHSSYTESHDMEAAAEYFKEGHEFKIANDSIIQEVKKKASFSIAIMVSLIIIGLVALVANFVMPKESTGVLFVLIVAFCFAAVELPMDTIPKVNLYKKIKNLPNYIYIDSNILVMGDKTYSADSILNILMVPSNYEILTRDMIIITKNNEKIKYNFGKLDYRGKLTYMGYDALYGTINLWCIVNNINFVKILG